MRKFDNILCFTEIDGALVGGILGAVFGVLVVIGLIVGAVFLAFGSAYTLRQKRLQRELDYLEMYCFFQSY